MTISDQQIRALTFLATACRPTGARRWDSDGTSANIAKVRERQLAEVVMAVIRAASDRDVDNPGVIPSAGSHWVESAAVATFVPRPFDRTGCCSVCSKPESECRSRWRDDHEFEPLERAAARKGATDVHRTVAALKDELAPIAPPPVTRTLDDRLAATPAERRDPRYGQLRERLACEDEAGFIQCPHEAVRATCAGGCNCPCDPCAPSRATAREGEVVEA